MFKKIHSFDSEKELKQAREREKVNFLMRVSKSCLSLIQEMKGDFEKAVEVILNQV
jgi:hypothetical protein